MNAFIDSPKLIVNGFGAWQGTLGEAFRLNRDRMASHLAFLCTSWDVDTGSSPLARGLHPAISRQPRRLRIIPARAGFTRPAFTRANTAPDHPRSRGVYTAGGGGASDPGGSSPLARGLRFVQVAAGGLHLDHPRSRGVYRRTCQTSRPTPGSSPLARGLPLRGCRSRSEGGAPMLCVKRRWARAVAAWPGRLPGLVCAGSRRG